MISTQLLNPQACIYVNHTKDLYSPQYEYGTLCSDPPHATTDL